MVPGMFAFVVLMGFCFSKFFLTTMLFCFSIGSSGVCTVVCSPLIEVLREDLCFPVSLYLGSLLAVPMPSIKFTPNPNFCLDLYLPYDKKKKLTLFVFLRRHFFWDVLFPDPNNTG